MRDGNVLSTLPAPASADRVKATLKSRAAALAVPIDRPRATSKDLNVIEFRLASERYALEHRYVREVQLLKDLTHLPCMPAFLRGVVNVRGQVLPVLDIKRFFELPEAGITDIHMVIVVQAGDVELGILADAIVGVRLIPLDSMQSTLPTLTDIRAKYLKGVTNEHIVILDALKILTDPKVAVNEEVDT